MCGERGSPGRCGWDEGREEGEKAVEHALSFFSGYCRLERGFFGATSGFRPGFLDFAFFDFRVAQGVFRNPVDFGAGLRTIKRARRRNMPLRSQ